MNPLPRFLGMALFVVLATLVALLAAPTWRRGAAEKPPSGSAVSSTSPATTAPPLTASPGAMGPSSPATGPQAARMATLASRLAFGVALIGLALAAALLFSLAMRPGRSEDTRAPFASSRTEIGALAKLAESSVAQGAELNRERDVRRRAEEDVQLKQQLLAQSLDEKIRLGRDLHDGIIQSLYAVGLTLESIRVLVKSDPAAADQQLEQMRNSLNTTIREVRTYITGLSPDNLRRASFSQALESLLAELRGGREVRLEQHVDDDAGALLTPDQAVEALQIAREAVSNALRHGRASAITLRFHKGDHELALLVQDNGTGFDPSVGRDGGHGLGNMRARAERIGATLRVTSQRGEGTRVVLTLPLQSTPTA